MLQNYLLVSLVQKSSNLSYFKSAIKMSIIGILNWNFARSHHLYRCTHERFFITAWGCNLGASWWVILNLCIIVMVHHWTLLNVNNNRNSINLDISLGHTICECDDRIIHKLQSRIAWYHRSKVAIQICTGVAWSVVSPILRVMHFYNIRYHQKRTADVFN